MSTAQGIKLVYGGGVFGIYVQDGASAAEWLDALEAGGCKAIDTAQAYQGSEKILGEANAGGRGFNIDTKDPAGGMGPGDKMKPEEIEPKLRESLKQLGMSQVDVFYFHAPEVDNPTPPEAFMPTIDKLHKEGLFKRYGLSNFEASHVEEICKYADEHKLVKPTVYQGNYNAIARKQETDLLPTLRKWGISFYAYSPLAGGFLTKTREQYEAGAGRFNDSIPMVGEMYKWMYGRPAMLDALSEWEAIAKEEGCSKAALGFRWVRYNSALKAEYGDAMIFGTSKLEQTPETLRDINAGPLKPDTVNKIDLIWEKVSHDAATHNSDFMKKAAA